MLAFFEYKCIQAKLYLLNVALMILLTFAASAQTVEEIEFLSDASPESLQEVLQIKTFVDANLQFCSDYAQDTTQDVQRAVEAWRFMNSIGNLSMILSETDIKFEGNILRLEEQLYKDSLDLLKARAINQAVQWCQQFPSQLQSEALDLKRSFIADLQNINDYHAMIVVDTRSSRISLDKQVLQKIETPSFQQLKLEGKGSNVIPTEFHCYLERTGNDYFVPDFIVQLKADGSYQSTFGSGRYTHEESALSWTGALSGSERSYYRTSFYGQTISFDDLSLDGRDYDLECFQQGSRERATLLNFELKDPQNASYSCQDIKGNVPADLPAIELLEGRRYKVGNEVGNYQVGFRGSYLIEVTFSSGPLTSSEATYKAESDGYRELKFSSVRGYFPALATSTSLSMICTNLAEALEYPKYGAELAPAPPAGSGGLSGLYAEFEIKSSRSSRSSSMSGSHYDFYYFTPEGYVYKGESDPKNIQCNRTKPSGQAYCGTYKLADDKIEMSFGTVKRNDLRPVEANPPTLDGRFWAGSFSSSGLCLVDARCSSSSQQFNITLRPTGEFYETSNRQSSTLNSSLNTIMPADFLPPDRMSYANASTSGSYTISGNTIEMRYNNGRVSRKFIAIFSPTSFHMAGWTYSLDEDE